MSQRRGLMSTLLAGLLFGTSVPVIKLGLNLNLSPDLFLELRFATASLVIILLLRGRGWVRRDIFRSRQVWLVGLINATGYVTQFQGQVLTSSSNAALIISTAALMIPVLSLVHIRERVVAKKVAGVVTGFVGTALVVTRGRALSVASSEFEGDLLILATAVTIALVFVISKRPVEQYGGRSVSGAIILLTSLLVLPSIPLDRNLTLNLTVAEWLCIAYLAVFATAGAYYFFMRGLESVSPTVSSIILPIEVIVAVGLSVVIFNDPFNLYSGTGAALIVVGIALVSTAA